MYMTNTFSFGNINAGNVKMVEENMVDKMFDYFYVYNESFTHEEAGLNFNYSYAVEVITPEEHDVDRIYVTLFLTVNEDSLCDRVKADILCGDKFDITPYDTVSNGYGAVKIATDELEDNIDIDEYVRMVFALIPAVDAFRGFYIDKTWNMLGSTGWDVIMHAVGLQDSIFNF